MTCRLILIRHAKSSWDDFDSDDHARVLNDRGRASATAIGAWLAKNGYIPELVLCSDAARTTETLSLIRPAFPAPPKVKFRSGFYHASPDHMLDVLQRQIAGTVAIVAHNPGIGALACGLAATRPNDTDFARYPTAATTVLDFDVDNWAQVRAGQGTMVDFATPRSLI